MLENGRSSELISEHEITQALDQNTKWHGTKEQMWSQIESKLESKSCSRQHRSWLTAAVAAAILFLVLFNQHNLPPQELMSELDVQPESAVQLFSTMSAFDAQTISKVAVAIDLPDTAAAGSQLNLNLSLTALEELTFTLEKPVVRLLRTDNNGLVTIISETTIDSWQGKVLDQNTPLSITSMLTAPQDPGSYLVEVSIPGMIDGQPYFFGETKGFSVTENQRRNTNE